MLRFIALLLLFLALATLLRGPFLFEPVLNWDESTFIIMGNDLAQGHLPFVHAWENKPPFLYVPYAIAVLLFGKNVVGVRIVGIVFIALATLALYRATVRVFGPASATLASLFLLLFASVTPGEFATMSEHIALPFICLALGLVLVPKPTSGQLVVLGLALGMMTMIRSNLLLLAACFFAILITRSGRQTLSTLARVAGGFAVPVLAVGLIYLATGQIHLLYRTLVLAPRAYASMSYALTPWESFEKMTFALRTFPQSMILYTGLAGAFLLVVDLAKRTIPRRPVVIILVLLAGSILAAVSTSRYFNHYFIQVIPFASVLAGRSLSLAWPYRMGRIFVVLLLCLPLRPVLGKGRDTLRDIRAGAIFEAPLYKVARHIRENGGAGNYAYFPQNPIVYFLSGALLPTRFVHPPALAKSRIVETIRGERHDSVSEVRALLAKEPVFVVAKGEIGYWRSEPEALALIEETLDREYGLESEIEGMAIYKRKRESPRNGG